MGIEDFKKKEVGETKEGMNEFEDFDLPDEEAKRLMEKVLAEVELDNED